VLLEAWKRIQAGRSNVRPLLLLVGSGQDDEAMRQLLALLPAGSVRWEDRFVVDRDLLWQYLSSADVATKPSRKEGFSVSIIEAMACGLPVVATDVSGVAEALGDDPAGVIVPPADAAALGEGLRRLLDDEPLRRSLGDRARRRAEEQFSFEAVGGRLRAFMEERGAFQSSG
jgi:glycosyltransferase involved in cell wall biosynthesis